MSWELKYIEGKKWDLVFSDEPTYVHALKTAPDSMEPELEAGTWLVVAFPVWSGPVRDSVRAAIDSAKHLSGRIQLGVRPYYFDNEILKWWPATETPAAAETMVEVRDMPERRELYLSTDHSRLPV
jgi:hypothetical protein